MSHSSAFEGRFLSKKTSRENRLV